MRKLLLLPLLAVLFTACSDSGHSGGGTGSIEIVGTDAPIDPSIVDTATVMIDRVRMHKDSEDENESGWVTLYDGDPVELPLASLRNGITSVIASGTLAAGTYRQVRLHIVGGTITLDNGNVYTTDDGSLDLPSSMTSSGYKVFLNPGVVIPAGGVEQVVLDFDLTKTFIPIPGNDPENATSFKLRPVVRAAVTSISGQLRATVRRDDGTGTLVGVPDAMVFVLQPGEVDTNNAVATSITDATGSAMVLGLLPGAYDVMASEGGVGARVDGNDVVTGESTLVQLVLP